MVEVLCVGNRNRVVCGFCGSLLSYQKDDISEKEKYISQRDSHFIKYIKCPQCKSLITLSGNVI